MFHEPHDHPIVQTTGFRIGTGVSTSVSISLRNVSHYRPLLQRCLCEYNIAFLWFSGVNGVTRHLIRSATVEFKYREQPFPRSYVSLWYAPGGSSPKENPRNSSQSWSQPLPPAILKIFDLSSSPGSQVTVLMT